ncbi:MAG: hypothetical protein OXG04_10415 [Acidobacteria bacterium]|nr:hypothetical protein [Acidobacteriota bacterium]
MQLRRAARRFSARASATVKRTVTAWVRCCSMASGGRPPRFR